jgi:hypothetical protein
MSLPNLTVPEHGAFAASAQHGLTKREYFAACALQGLASNGGSNPALAAFHAVFCADVLIDELNKTETKEEPAVVVTPDADEDGFRRDEDVK